MSTPKRRMSRSRTRSRKANWKATPTALVPVQFEGQTVQVPRRLARAVERGLYDPS